MKSPLDLDAPWLEVASVDSTQRLARELLAQGKPVGVLMAEEQIQGVGRFGRPWYSERGDSLAVSFVFSAYADHPQPYLVGMALALAAAGVLRCQVMWPNDLVVGEKKLAGVLSELVYDSHGRRVPIVGIGINLNQKEFPEEIAHRATSLHLAHGGSYEPRAIAQAILDRLASLPEPSSWQDLGTIWSVFDRTPGKRYRLPSGEEAVALGIGSQGQLLCSVDGESRVVLAAEALFGPSEERSND